jgi:hypothetical protein
VIRFLRRDTAKSPEAQPLEPQPPELQLPEFTDPERLISLADQHFERGEVVEAIALLTAANRRHRDHRFERRLVTMRFDAFEQVDWSRSAGTVPASVPDLFPGDAIPEIAGADLSLESVQSAMLNHGSVIVRGLVGPERVAQLTADIDRALDGYDAWIAGKGLATAAPWFVPFAQEPKKVERKFRRDVGGVLVVDSPPALFDVIDTFDEAGIRPVVEGFFNEPAALLAKKWTLRRVPHDSGESGWHQDGSFMGGDIRSLNVWLALSHCGDDAPGLDVVSRRLDRLVPTGSHGAWLDWTVGPEMVEQVAPGGIVRPIFEPGDALIFDHMNLHRTAVDPGMVHDRYAVEAWFLAPSTYATMMAEEVAEGAPPRDQLPMIY